MPAEIRIVLNSRGIGEIAKGDQLKAHLLGRARRVESAARAKVPSDERPFITASAWTGRRRARASVMYRGGLRREVDERILGRSIDAARG